MYDTSTYPYRIRSINPDCLRALARSLEREADNLPSSVAAGQGEAISSAVDAALVRVTWELSRIADDLVSSFNGKGSNRDRHATAIHQCAEPLGLAQYYLAKAMDHVSSHHHAFASTMDKKTEPPKELLLALQQYIDHARDAIYATANQFTTNASLLG
ncbi:hypothetical protein ACFC0S_00250 [Streptomyces sp. NPDC056084]|uniref:hypothetical protein n=1 Tax=unclassified Streptomyces TaxID=2593676 RepID=UPI0035DFC83F